MPAVGQFVWYAVNQRPRLGQVMSVDPTVPRPVVVEVFEPQANAVSLPRARFRRSLDRDSGKPRVDHITLHQVKVRFEGLTPRGLLKGTDRDNLRRCLEE